MFVLLGILALLSPLFSGFTDTVADGLDSGCFFIRNCLSFCVPLPLLSTLDDLRLEGGLGLGWLVGLEWGVWVLVGVALLILPLALDFST